MENQTLNLNKEILAKLIKLQSDVEYIKSHISDIDSMLTPDEEEILDTSLIELKEGRTTSHEKIKKELGL